MFSSVRSHRWWHNVVYITIDDMAARYPLVVLAQLTDDTDGTSVDNPVLTVLIAESESIVHGYLRDRYSLPLQQCPEDLKGCICAIVYYKAYRRRQDDVPQGVTDAYNASIDYLTKAQRGAIVLALPENQVAPALPLVMTNKRAEDKVMAKLLSQMP